MTKAPDTLDVWALFHSVRAKIVSSLAPSELEEDASLTAHLNQYVIKVVECPSVVVSSDAEEARFCSAGIGLR